MDDRCLKHTLLVKLQPNSSRQLLSSSEEAPACAEAARFCDKIELRSLRSWEATVPGTAGRWHNFLTFMSRMDERGIE